MNVTKEPEKKEPTAPKAPKTMRFSDPGMTPGSAEGERAPMKESLGERPSAPNAPRNS